MESLKRIVIVDDSETNRDIITEMVNEMAEVDHAIAFGDPTEALNWLTLNHAALIIIDYRMPELHGIDLTILLRQTQKHASTPIVMVSAVSDRTIKHQALGQGASHFMTRPLDVIEFQTNCRTLLMIGDKFTSKKVNPFTLTYLNSDAALEQAQLTPSEAKLITLLAKQVEFREGRDGSHLERMAAVTLEVARASSQFTELDYAFIPYASLLYDVGKIKLKDNLTMKEGLFDESESHEMRLHAEFGYNLLMDIGMAVTQYAAEVALYHHENFDGTGYPYGLKGIKIPAPARLVAITSTLNAMVSDRPFRQPFSLSYAIDHINHFKGVLFDPEMVESLNSVLPTIQAVYETSG